MAVAQSKLQFLLEDHPWRLILENPLSPPPDGEPLEFFPAAPIVTNITPPASPLTTMTEAVATTEAKKTRKSFLMKMRLIGWIVVDYIIDLFNRSSKDYRNVSKKLSEMKSRDKILQQEERIRAQTIVDEQVRSTRRREECSSLLFRRAKLLLRPPTKARGTSLLSLTSSEGIFECLDLVQDEPSPIRLIPVNVLVCIVYSIRYSISRCLVLNLFVIRRW